MITITHRWASLSRGRICAKHLASGRWASRGDACVHLDTDGRWMISATDGFNRKETKYIEVIDGAVKGQLSGRFEQE